MAEQPDRPQHFQADVIPQLTLMLFAPHGPRGLDERWEIRYGLNFA